MIQIRVKEGILEGVVTNNEYGGKIYSFKGIPYAQPPLGELRFKVNERESLSYSTFMANRYV